MARLSVDSLAKVNLYLNVLGLRPDGYHDIQTIFSLITLKDKIILEEDNPGEITVSSDNKSLPLDENNLAGRAAKLLIDHSLIKKGIKIFIEKNIPISAGLGGGSSNAAAVLLGLNKLWKLGLSRQNLAGLGQQLGADVPFFVGGYPTALATGLGEEITPVECRSVLKFILINPKLEVSTEKVYKQWDRFNQETGLTKPDSDAKIVSRKLETGRSGEIGGLLYNSLEQAASSLFPEISEVKKELTNSGIEQNLMSGSGPTVFGLIRDRKEGDNLRKDIILRGRWWVELAENFTTRVRRKKLKWK